MSDYRRFVSYIYAYKDGKKEKNAGFAKVEARNGNLKISIQLENVREGQERLDAYGFVRKGEKLYGIPLGEMPAAGSVLKVTTSVGNVAGSGYPLRNLAGLWLKGNQGENYITIWDDEPVDRMELEVELREEPQKMSAEREEQKESRQLEVSVEQEKVREEPSEVSAEQEKVREEPSEVSAEQEKVREEPSEVFAGHEKAEEGTLEVSAEPEETIPNAPNYGIWKVVLAEEPLKGEKNINGVRAQEAAAMAAVPAQPECEKQSPDSQKSGEYLPENEKNWNILSPTYPHLNPFLQGEALDCVRITPRELYLFRKRNWNASKNSFILHGYYNFRHLIFGRFSDGSYFLGVPGLFSAQEQRAAASFGFPIFKDGRETRKNGRFGYWCRILS